MGIIDSIKNWAKEHNVSKWLLVIILIIIWCLAVIFLFRDNTGFFYRD